MARDRRRGVVLLVVLLFALLLTGSIATFVRRATVDAMIARNRDAAARADALLRGGVRLATALLLEDRFQEGLPGALPLDTYRDIWASPLGLEIPSEDGDRLRLRIHDAGARLNLNALLVPQLGAFDPRTELFLHALLEKVVDEMPVAPGQKQYDVRELAANLIDWIDTDDVRQRGGPEDAYYQEQDPPYRAANRPLLSVDELRLVEGFDRQLVDELAPYVTVYPYVGGQGVNLNTAPPHVLALLFFDDGVDLRLAQEDDVRRIIDVRLTQGVVCPQGSSQEGCAPIRQLVTNEIFPPPTFTSDVFTVEADAWVGEVRRGVVAVVDRSQPSEPRLLSWRAQ